MSDNKHQKTVAIDLDNCLADYDGWKGWDTIGAPKAGAHEAVNQFHDAGWRIIIFTTRADAGHIREWVRGFLNAPIHYINHNPANADLDCGTSKPIADLYIDDRAWPLCGEWPGWDKVMADLDKRGIL